MLLDNKFIMSVNTNKLGLVFAVLMGGVHVIWSIVVFFGLGQPLLNFIFWAHMVSVPFHVGLFSMTASLSLIAIMSALGYLVGCIVGMVWNKVYSAA